MGLMTGQHPSISYPAPTASMSAEALVAQGTGSPVLCPLTAAYDSRLLGAPTASPYAQHRFNVADFYGNGPVSYSDSAVAAAAAAAAAAGYVTGIPPSHPAAMLYPASLSAYDLKDPRGAWAALPQAAGYPCDPTLVAYGAYGDRFDPVDSEARRRNATRETTSTLKAWLNEHRKNPYPTKGEKIMLAIITKMTLTQVSTWFANARRRLKKENKMTWEPRNKTNDDLDDVSIEDDDEEDDKKDDDDINVVENKNDTDRKSDTAEKNMDVEKKLIYTTETKRPSEEGEETKLVIDDRISSKDSVSPDISKTPENIRIHTDISTSEKKADSKANPAITKPKIWSLAQTAISNSPPSSRKITFPTISSQDDIENRLRMSRFLYRDGMIPSELNYSHFAHRSFPRDISTDVASKTRLHQDNSTESSLSSPPLQPIVSPEKFGRLTPYDSSDLRSVSSSSSISPSTATSCIEGSYASIQAGLSYTSSRFTGCRLIPYSQDSGTSQLPLSLTTSERYAHHLGHSLSSNIELRTIQSSFLKSSPYVCAVNFSSPQADQNSDLRR